MDASMLIEFDQNTLANMTAALEFVCKWLPKEKDNHETRKRVANKMISCAKAGKRNYVDFVDVGAKTLKEIMRPARFNWFGLRR
jgi:hypothetical protein